MAAQPKATNDGDTGVGCILKEAVSSIGATAPRGDCLANGMPGIDDRIVFAPGISDIALIGKQLQIGIDVPIPGQKAAIFDL